MQNTLLQRLLHYGKLIADYNFEDKEKGCIRVKYIEDIQLTHYVYTVVIINGEYISVGLNMELDS